MTRYQLRPALVVPVMLVIVLAAVQAAGPPFGPPATYGSGGYGAYSVVVADVNGDGRPDLVVANCGSGGCGSTGGAVSVLLGKGDGTFQTPVSYYTGGIFADSVAAADVNGDGRPDLVVANYCATANDCSNGTVGVLLGNGNGTFQAVVTYGSGGSGAQSVALADVNGDGRPDVVVANCSGSDGGCGSSAGAVSVLLGKGDGTFQAAVVYGSGGVTAVSVSVADVNGDGKPDLLVANSCVTFSNCEGAVGVLIGNGDGTFRQAAAYGSGGGMAESVAVADVNGDGKRDVVVANYCATGSDCSNGTVAVLLGKGDGTFLGAVAYNSGGKYATGVAVGDVNGDGKRDVAVVNQFGPLGLFSGNGDGTFQQPVTFSAGAPESLFLSFADLNGDGKDDLVVTNFCAGSSCAMGTVSVLMNLAPSSDLTAPTTKASPSSSPNLNGWSNANVTVGLTATDNPGGTGVKQIQWWFGGAQNTSLQTVPGNAASVTISAEGTTVLTYFATDNAGNQETARTLTVRIDKTPPVLSGLPAPGCAIWPANHKLIQVATVAANDSLSGIAPGSFQITVISSDPKNGQIVITGGPNPYNVQLGADKDVTYTLTATAKDLAGNASASTATCTVPHDQGQ